MTKEVNLLDLFLELAQPNSQGFSRWVKVTEFTGEYQRLYFKNGWSWGRNSSTLKQRYLVEVDRSLTSGNSIDAIRLVGFNQEEQFKHNIRKDIKDVLKLQKCVMLGINGKSENTRIEIDHKDGRKNDFRVSDIKTQRLDDFQPLCKAANDVKRQICKICKETNKRWSAKNIAGNPYDFYQGDENYSDELGCVGCYQYDPVEYRRCSVKRISEEAAKHTSDFIFQKLYSEEDKE